MIYIAPAFSLSCFPSEASGGFTEDDVAWYSLYSAGTLVSDNFGNTETLKGSFGPENPRILWNNLLLPRTVQADYENPDFPAANVGNVSTAEYWKTAEGEEETEQFIYFGTEEYGAVDSVAIAGHNLGTLAADYKLQSRGGVNNWQEIDIGSDKTGTDIAIDAIDGVFEFLISIDGAAFQTITLTYSSATNVTFTDFLADINAELTGATATLEGGNLRITSDVSAPLGSIQLQSVSGVNYFATYVNGYISIDNSTGWADVFAYQTAINDRAILYQFCPQAGRSWRLSIKPQAGTTTAAKIATLVIGRALVIPRRLYVGHTPINYGRMTKKVSNRSDNGNYLGDVIVSTTLKSKFAFQNLGPIFYRVYIDPFVEHARSRPFVWAWYPSKYPDECAYVSADGDIQMSNQRPNGMVEFSASITGISP